LSFLSPIRANKANSLVPSPLFDSEKSNANRSARMSRGSRNWAKKRMRRLVDCESTVMRVPPV